MCETERTDTDATADWAAWIETVSGRKPSRVGEKAAAVLDYVYSGLHHLRSADRIRWDGSLYVEAKVPDGLSTWDFDLLTRLVIGCHRYCVRCEVLAAY